MKTPTDPSKDLDVVLIGRSTALFRVSTLSYILRITKSAAIKFLRTVKVPILHIGKYGYFSTYELDKALFTLSRVGQTDYAAPGSDYKNKNQHRRANTPAIVEVDDEFVALANSEMVEKDMTIAARRRGDIAINVVKQLMRLEGKNEQHRSENDRGVERGTDGVGSGGGDASGL